MRGDRKECINVKKKLGFYNHFTIKVELIDRTAENSTDLDEVSTYGCKGRIWEKSRLELERRRSREAALYKQFLDC